MSWYQVSLVVDPDQVEVHQNMVSMLLEVGCPEEVQQYRDLVYRRQVVFIDIVSNPIRIVLVLWVAGKGNVSVQFLLSVKIHIRIIWMMEYVT